MKELKTCVIYCYELYKKGKVKYPKTGGLLLEPNSKAQTYKHCHCDL